jgi:hypothetical protein
VDEVVLADMGIAAPRQAPVLRRVYQWSGLAPAAVVVDGDRPDLHGELRGAHASRAWRALGAVSGLVYEYLSDGGKIFVPAIDEVSFPPLVPIRPIVRVLQWTTQRAFGLRAPARRPVSSRTTQPG